MLLLCVLRYLVAQISKDLCRLALTDKKTNFTGLLDEFPIREPRHWGEVCHLHIRGFFRDWGELGVLDGHIIESCKTQRTANE